MCIDIRQLSKTYGYGKGLLPTSLAVHVGEIVAIVGHNGAGKSTLLKLLANWVVPSSGDATINGFQLNQRRSVVREIGFVPETANLFESFSVEYNLKLFARLFKLPLSRVDEICRDFKLGSFRKQRVGTLSKGQKQRVVLGRSLLPNPSILLLDEPTSGLDFEMTRDIQSYLASLNKSGKTVVFTSHRPEEVKALANRIIVVHAGGVVFDGSSYDYFNSLTHQEIFA